MENADWEIIVVNKFPSTELKGIGLSRIEDSAMNFHFLDQIEGAFDDQRKKQDE